VGEGEEKGGGDRGEGRVGKHFDKNPRGTWGERNLVLSSDEGKGVQQTRIPTCSKRGK